MRDKAARKRTTIVLFGRTFGLVTYLLNGILAFLITLPLLMDASPWLVCLFAAFSVLFAATWLEMKQYQGRELNRTLGHTARNVFIYACCFQLYCYLVLKMCRALNNRLAHGDFSVCIWTG